MDLPQVGVPHHPQLGVLLLQLPELGQEGLGVLIRGQGETIGEHRLQKGRGCGGLRPQALAGIGLGKAQHRADLAGLGGLRRLELGAGVQPQLSDLFLCRLLPVEGQVGDGVPDGQGSAGEL